MNNEESSDRFFDNEELLQEMYMYRFHMLSSVNGVEFDRVQNIGCELLRFSECVQFYNVKKHNFLNKTLDFILRFINFYLKITNSHDSFQVLMVLVTKIVRGINLILTRCECDITFENEIQKIVQLVSWLLESNQILFQTAGGELFKEIVEINSVNFSDLHVFYDKLIEIFRGNELTDNFSSLIYAVINRKGRNCATKNDSTPSFLSLETECLNYLLKQEIDEDARESIVRCLILLYKYNKFEFSSETMTMMPHLHKVCLLMQDENCREIVEQLLTHMIVKSEFFSLTKNQILSQIKLLPDKYEEWPFVINYIFFIVVYFLMKNSELLWSKDNILQSICKFVQSTRKIDDDVLKCILMLYSFTWDNNSDENILNAGVIILSHVDNHKNISQILTCHQTPVMWLLKNAEDLVAQDVLEYWIQMETQENHIAKALQNSQNGHRVVNLIISCSDLPILLRTSKVLTKLQEEPQLSAAIHQAIIKVCDQIYKLEYLLMAKFCLPEDPELISMHMEILHVALPLFTDDDARTAGCSYLNLLIKSFSNIKDFTQFNQRKLRLLVKFLISVSCGSEDNSAVAACELVTTLLDSNQLNSIGNYILVPFTKIVIGSSKRIRCGIELLCKVLLNEDCIMLSLSEKIFKTLYTHLFDILSDQTAFSITRALKLMIDIKPELYLSKSTAIILKNLQNKLLSENTTRLIKVFFKFAKMKQDSSNDFLQSISSAS